MAGKSTIAQLNVLLSLDSSRLARGIRMAQGRISVFSKAGGSLMKSFGNVATGALAAAALGFGSLAAAAIRSGLEFDKSMTKMITLVGLAESEVNSMRNTVIQLAGDMGTTAKKAADAMFFITSAGLRGKDAMEALEASLRSQAIGLGDASGVADIMTATMNAYGSANINAAKSADILTATVRHGKLETEALASVMGSVIPLAANMGIEFNEVGAAFAAMSRTGSAGDAAKIGTQLRQIMASLLKPSKQASDALKDMGLSAKVLREEMRGDLLNGLFILKAAFEGNEDATAKVFGEVRALTGIMDLLGENVVDTVSIFEDMKDVTGENEQAFDKWSKTVSGKASIVSGKFRKAISQLGEVFMANSGHIADWLGQLADKFPKIYNSAVTRFVKMYNAMADMRNGTNAWGLALRYTLNVALNIFDTLKGIGKTIWTIGGGIVKMIKGFANGGIVGMSTAIGELVSNLGALREADYQDFLSDLEGGDNKDMKKLNVNDYLIPEGTTSQQDRASDEALVQQKKQLKYQDIYGRARLRLKWLQLKKGIDLEKYYGEQEVERVEKINSSLVSLGTTLANAFNMAFSSIQSGMSVFKALGQAILNVTKRLIAAAVAAALLSLVMPANLFGLGAGASFGDKFKTLFSSMANLPKLALSGKATGGRVNAGQPYIVGEKGHEMFVPDHSGKIVPHSSTVSRGAASGGAVEVIGVISGQNINLSSKRASSYSKRYGG